MRRPAICLIALTFILAQCGGGGGDDGRRDTGGTPPDGAVADSGADVAQEDTGTPGDDAPDVPSPPPDAGDVSTPQPDAGDVGGGEETQTGADADVGQVTDCDGDQDCQHLATPCTIATCDGGTCATTPKNCRETPEDDLCTIDICNAETGACEHAPNPDCCCLSAQDCTDDADPCTITTCDLVTDPSCGKCGFTASTEGCDDNNPCTTGETCTAVAGPRVAVCAGAQPTNCDDAVEATIDVCDPTDADGNGDPCVHQGQVACPGGQSDCPPAAGCVAFICDDDPTTPLCEATDRTGSCNDGNFCTSADTCQGGVCVGGDAPDCDDNDPTTCDSCLPTAGCQHVANCAPPPCVTVADCGAPPANTCRAWVCEDGYCRDVSLPDETSCEDGLFCTEGDACFGGNCQAGLPRDCDDADPSTTCTCDETNKRCDCTISTIPQWCLDLNEDGLDCCAIGSDCDDDDACTTDSCLTFVDPTVCTSEERPNCRCDAASGGAANCDDGDAATVDVCCTGAGAPHEECLFADVCIHDFTGIPCEQACTGLNDDAACDDDDKCTLDSCEVHDATEGTFCCLNVAQPDPCGRACPDGDEDCGDGLPCTIDHCGADGTCDIPVTRDPCCTSDESCPEDANPCTTRQCDVANGTCGFVNNTDGCNDDDACTVNDVCAAGACSGEARVCPDDPPCYVGVCDTDTGCGYEPVADPPAECESCLTNPGKCEDYNACTNDICLPAGVCENVDVNTGTDTPLCQPIECRDESDCDDGNPCTTDGCVRITDPDGDGPIVPVSGCVYVEAAACNIPAPLVCNVATVNEDCDPLECVTDNASAFCKNPSEVCPTPYCDVETGCRFLPTAACPLAQCTPANQHLTCWDQSPCTVDECDPATLLCVDPEERASAHPADSLYNLCYPCETPADCPEVGSFDLDDPCVTVECLKPANPYVDADGNVDPAGVCYAHTDQEVFPNGCEDYDLCTLDACLEGGGCGNEPRGASCTVCMTDGDCDDFDACTTDRCPAAHLAIPSVGFTCTHTPVFEDCRSCTTQADCDDLAATASFCDKWLCINGVCQEPQFNGPDQPVCDPGTGCMTAAECEAGDPSLLPVCSTDNQDCLWVPNSAFLGCETVNDCFTIEPCQRPAACIDGVCDFDPVANCDDDQPCADVTDCDDGRTCTVDLCNEGQCTYIWSQGCCDVDADCLAIWGTEYDECSAVSCGPDHACYIVSFHENARCGSECEDDTDCSRTCTDVTDPTSGEVTATLCQTFCLSETECYDWPCSEGRCNANGRCLWFDGGCTGCDGDEDCADPDPCTDDECVAGQCVHNPTPACTPVACDVDNPCQSDDLCVIGTCLEQQCVWFPSPLPGCPGTLPEGF